MTSSSFPDINVWLALIAEDHRHHSIAKKWWQETSATTILFSRFTQIGLLRLLTTAAVMGGLPLTMDHSWHVYDHLYKDDRVRLLPEPLTFEPTFRDYARGRVAAPKTWADAYLLAFAHESGSQLVTFDQALAARGPCLLLPVS